MTGLRDAEKLQQPSVTAGARAPGASAEGPLSSAPEPPGRKSWSGGRARPETAAALLRGATAAAFSASCAAFRGEGSGRALGVMALTARLRRALPLGLSALWRPRGRGSVGVSRVADLTLLLSLRAPATSTLQSGVPSRERGRGRSLRAGVGASSLRSRRPLRSPLSLPLSPVSPLSPCPPCPPSPPPFSTLPCPLSPLLSPSRLPAVIRATPNPFCCMR